MILAWASPFNKIVKFKQVCVIHEPKSKQTHAYTKLVYIIMLVIPCMGDSETRQCQLNEKQINTFISNL